MLRANSEGSNLVGLCWISIVIGKNRPDSILDVFIYFNLCIQLLLLSCIRSSRHETEQGPVGPFWVQKPFWVPRFSFVGNSFIQPPRPSLSSKGQIQTAAHHRRVGMQKQRRSSQETKLQP